MIRRVILYSLWVIALALTPVVAMDGEPADDTEPIVPPGQEELLVEMLGRGATLPDHCTLRAAQAEYTRVTATYGCPDGEVVFELVHPDAAEAPHLETEQFGITIQSGDPPAGLADAVATLVRSHEEAFEWRAPTRDDGADAPE